MHNLPKPLVWAGMALMLVTGSIHLIASPTAFEDAVYKGALVVVASISALIAASGIQEGGLVRGWGLGSLVALIAFGSYMVDSTVGLPGLAAEPGAWQDPLGLLALASEGLLVVLAVVAFHLAQHPERSAPGRLRA